MSDMALTYTLDIGGNGGVADRAAYFLSKFLFSFNLLKKYASRSATPPLPPMSRVYVKAMSDMSFDTWSCRVISGTLFFGEFGEICGGVLPGLFE